jgi:hypothetical protein
MCTKAVAVVRAVGRHAIMLVTMDEQRNCIFWQSAPLEGLLERNSVCEEPVILSGVERFSVK